jgi:TolB-like protein
MAAVAASTRQSHAQCPDGSPPPCARPARAGSAPPTSVAVLSFENLSGDTSDAYLADGLAEEVTARLGQVERLVVTSRTSVRRLREAATMTPQQLGRALNVAYIVNGSVRRAGARLRVTVELLRATTGVQAWSRQFDSGDGDLLGIQEQVAGAVATAIAGRLLPQERATLRARPTRNPAAYDRFLRGNYNLAQRTQHGIARAIAEYEAALRMDPGFTAALSRIAYAYAQYLNWGWAYAGLPPESLLARGLSAADRAIRADSTTSDAWMARGFLLNFRDPRTMEGAREAFERAVALDPHNVEAIAQYGVTLMRLGDFSTALAAYHRAADLDPTRTITLRDLGLRYIFLRRYRDALRWLDSAIAVDSLAWFAYADRARARLLVGDSAGSRRDAEATARLSPPASRFFGEALLAMVEARAADSARARARLDRAIAHVESSPEGVTPRAGFMLGAALVSAGEPDRALDLLELVRPRGAQLWSYLETPEFDPIRSHPRFVRLLEESQPPAIR